MNNSRTRKNIMPVKTVAVPMYQLNEGTCYDVKSTGMILKEAEYAGYEVVGRLVIYRFRTGGSEYKISEPAIRRGGGIQISGTYRVNQSGTTVIDQHEFPWHTGRTPIK